MTFKQLIGRQKKIKAMIADERSYRYIGKKLGISAARVAQIFHHEYKTPSTKK